MYAAALGKGLSVVGTRVSILVSPSSGAAVVGGHVCACVSDPVLHIGDLYRGVITTCTTE